MLVTTLTIAGLASRYLKRQRLFKALGMAKKKARYCVGLDLGGTSLFAAVVDMKKQTVLATAKRKTRAEQGADAVVERLARTATDAIKSAGLTPQKIGGLGVGVPGPILPEQGIVVRCANLGPTWDNYPLAQRLSALLPAPIVLDNDVNVGAVGEHAFGAGAGTQDLLAIFVGTGVGGGIILGGKLRVGPHYSAGEIGHTVLQEGGALCGCGQAGHAEALCSRSAIERYISEAVEAGRPSLAIELWRESGKETMTSGIIGDAYEQGDTVTREAVARAQHYLGLLIANCANTLDPEIVVVGGGMLERFGEAYLGPVRAAAMPHYINPIAAEETPIVPASLGDRAGAVGAAILAAQRLARR